MEAVINHYQNRKVAHHVRLKGRYRFEYFTTNLSTKFK